MEMIVARYHDGRARMYRRIHCAPWVGPLKAPLVGAFSLAAPPRLMLCALARSARPEQPLCGIGNEQVPIGIDFPLNRRPALFLGNLDPELGRRLDPLAQ